MIAAYAWTNSQIINVTNAVANLYAGEGADLYVRTGAHISTELLKAVEKSGVYDHVFYMDPIQVDYKKMRFGSLRGIRVLFLHTLYARTYAERMDQLCKGKVYSRALLTCFYVDNVFLVDYWARSNPQLPITLVEEGTGSYCYHPKDLLFPLALQRSRRDKIRRCMTEGPLALKYSKNVDSFALYRPEYARPDVPYKKLRLPEIREDSNPVLFTLLRNSVEQLDPAHFSRYNASDVIYLSTFNPEGASFDRRSMAILETLIDTATEERVIAKIHMGDAEHAKSFAKSVEDRIFVDREVYLFEGMYMQLKQVESKVLVSCASSAAINAKFMFGLEPYIIFTFPLYETYQKRGVERDDWMAAAVIDSYEDKSRIMLPQSLEELKEMLAQLLEEFAPKDPAELDEH